MDPNLSLRRYKNLLSNPPNPSKVTSPTSAAGTQNEQSTMKNQQSLFSIVTPSYKQLDWLRLWPLQAEEC